MFHARRGELSSITGVTTMRTSNTASIFGTLLLVFAGSLAAAEDKKEDEKQVELNVGDAAPVFESTNDEGKTWMSADIVGKKIVVVYFFPADFTSGCRLQAQNFRDTMNKLAEKGVVVVGISGDSVFNHELFKKVEQLNFTLLADEEGALAKKFGVPVGKGGVVRPRDAKGKVILDPDDEPVVLKRGVTMARWTFIIGTDGKVLYKNTKVNPAQDSKQVTEFIEQLQKK
jgi:peroxiredoxin Q/BCP